MTQLLYVSSSVRPNTSQSHKLGQYFCKEITRANPDMRISTRNVGTNPPPHPDEAYTVANYTPSDERNDEMRQALAVSDGLIDELQASDRIVFSVPMYNFSIPSTFKAYIDNLVRIGRTFETKEDGSFSGLLIDKKALVITARGAMYGEGSPIRDLDFQEPYLRTVFGFMGLTDMEFVHADGLDFGGETYREESLLNARKTLEKIAKTW